MKIRLLILCIIIGLHFLTPRFFYSDILRICDWIIISCMLIAIITFFYNQDNSRIKLFTFILTINSLLYFLITVRESIPDVGDPVLFYRIPIIMNIKSNTANEFGYFIEYINYIQALFSVAILLILLISILFGTGKVRLLKKW
jgi:hypothetical protein